MNPVPTSVSPTMLNLKEPRKLHFAEFTFEKKSRLLESVKLVQYKSNTLEGLEIRPVFFFSNI